MDDLVVLVADKNMQFALQGVLKRPQALGIRRVTHQFRVHIGRDGGVRSSGPEMLEIERTRFSHALLILDYEGCGATNTSALAVEDALDQRLERVWGKAGKAIVVSPEIDAWMWGSDTVLRQVLSWPLKENIRDWLRQRGFEFGAHQKPLRPKEALDAMRLVHRLPRSSAVYEKITGRISLQNCSDQAFQRLRTQLQSWFPSASPQI